MRGWLGCCDGSRDWSGAELNTGTSKAWAFFTSHLYSTGSASIVIKWFVTSRRQSVTQKILNSSKIQHMSCDSVTVCVDGRIVGGVRYTKMLESNLDELPLISPGSAGVNTKI